MSSPDENPPVDNGRSDSGGAEAPDPLPEITRSPVTAFAIGLVAGVASALLGVGGGLLMVPALVFFLRFRQHRAVGTSLAVILPTALAGAYRYNQQSLTLHSTGLDLRVVLWLAVGGVGGAIIGAKIANALGAAQLRRLFGAFVVVTGMVMISGLTRGHQADPAAAARGLDAIHSVQMFLVGGFSGVISGLLGVGGGIVMVPMLALLLGYPQHLAQGTSLAVIIPVSISGALAHALKGNIVWSIAYPLALGAVLGAWLMAGQVFAIPDDILRTVFGAFLIAVGVSMVNPGRQEKPPPADEPKESE